MKEPYATLWFFFKKSTTWIICFYVATCVAVVFYKVINGNEVMNLSEMESTLLTATHILTAPSVLYIFWILFSALSIIEETTLTIGARLKQIYANIQS